MAFGIDFENFAFAGQLSKNVTGTLKKIGFLNTITWNQLVRCTYGVILSCFEGAVAFGIDFENFAFAGQLSKNVTGTCKKNWFSQEIHQITPDKMKPTGQMHLRGHPELFWRRCGIWNRFRKFCVCRPTIKKRHWHFKKNWFSQEIHKITPDNMKPTGQMHLRGHPELFWRRCGIWNRFQKFCVCRPTIKKRHWHL